MIKIEFLDENQPVEVDAETVAEAVQISVKNGANLRGADLSGADLRGADLSGAAL